MHVDCLIDSFLFSRLLLLKLTLDVLLSWFIMSRTKETTLNEMKESESASVVKVRNHYRKRERDRDREIQCPVMSLVSTLFSHFLSTLGSIKAWSISTAKSETRAFGYEA